MKNTRFFGTAAAVAASLTSAGAGDVSAQPKPAFNTITLTLPAEPTLPPKIPATEVIPHAYSPRMTRMPDSHLVAAFQVTQNGRTLYVDTHGHVIRRLVPGTRQVQWSGSNPPAPPPILRRKPAP